MWTADWELCWKLTNCSSNPFSFLPDPQRHFLVSLEVRCDRMIMFWPMECGWPVKISCMILYLSALPSVIHMTMSRSVLESTYWKWQSFLEFLYLCDCPLYSYITPHPSLSTGLLRSQKFLLCSVTELSGFTDYSRPS